MEDQLIAPDTSLILVGNTSEDLSVIEVYAYDEKSSNLYVHHDITLPSFPLCLQWIGKLSCVRVCLRSCLCVFDASFMHMCFFVVVVDWNQARILSRARQRTPLPSKGATLWLSARSSPESRSGTSTSWCVLWGLARARGLDEIASWHAYIFFPFCHSFSTTAPVCVHFIAVPFVPIPCVSSLSFPSLPPLRLGRDRAHGDSGRQGRGEQEQRRGRG